MPAYAAKLSDREIADVVTYIRNAWGNAAPAVTAAEVAKARK
jgi:mono/diheme cytochrome c family protein